MRYAQRRLHGLLFLSNVMRDHLMVGAAIAGALVLAGALPPL